MCKSTKERRTALSRSGHSDKKYHFPRMLTEAETRFRVELVVLNLTKNDSGYDYQVSASERNDSTKYVTLVIYKSVFAVCTNTNWKPKTFFPRKIIS
jgi:hypothetical protein